MEKYEAFVRAHWGVHPKQGQDPDPAVFHAMTNFAKATSSLAHRAFLESGLKPSKDSFIAAAGLLGETGEIIEHLKKQVRDGKFDHEAVLLELGDALFYLTRLSQTLSSGSTRIKEAFYYLEHLAGALGYTMPAVAEANVKKLEARYGKR